MHTSGVFEARLKAWTDSCLFHSQPRHPHKNRLLHLHQLKLPKHGFSTDNISKSVTFGPIRMATINL